MNQLGQQNILSLIKSLMQETAISLGKSLDQLDYPNTNRGDAPFNEANILVHLTAALRAQHPDALFYAEVPITGKGRIDLLASIENVNLIVEAKGLGGVRRCADLQDQLMRFEQFSPACSDREDEKECGKWWKSAEATYGLAVIGSHKEISNAWRSGGSSKVPDLFADLELKPRSAKGARRDAAALACLLDYLDTRSSQFGVERVLGTKMFKGTSPLDLLWAVFPIPLIEASDALGS